MLHHQLAIVRLPLCESNRNDLRAAMQQPIEMTSSELGHERISLAPKRGAMYSILFRLVCLLLNLG